MLRISRRNFIKLGMSTTAALASGVGYSKLLMAKELDLGGRSYNHITAAKERISVGTTCSLCRYYTCGALAFVEEGAVVAMGGNPIHPSSRARLCPLGNTSHLKIHDPDRILFPLKRMGPRGSGKWKRITWDDALNEVAGKVRAALDKGKPEEICLNYGRDETDGAIKRFIHTLGSNSIFNTSCHNKKVGMESTWGAEIETPDFAKTRYIINFGANIFETAYPHARRTAASIRENGAKIVTFDPRLSNTAGRSDEWYPIFPGTDGLVALAMSNVIMQEGLADKGFIDTWTNYPYDGLKTYLQQFTPEMAEEKSGVRADVIKRVAIEFAKAMPGTVFTFRGVSAHLFGVYQERACMLLPIITGNVEIKGGYCLPRAIKLSQPAPSLSAAVSTNPASAEYPLPAAASSHLLPFFIKDGRQKAGVLFNYMSNPVYSSPAASYWRDVLKDEKLVPYTVDFSPFMSETAELADLILPDAVSLERHGIVSVPSTLFPTLDVRQPAVKPIGESMDTRFVLQRIIQSIDPDDKKGFKKQWDFKDGEDWVKKNLEGINLADKYKDLKEKGVLPVYERLDPKIRDIVDKGGKPIEAEYGIYKKPLTQGEMEKAKVDLKKGAVIKDGKTIGIVVNGAKLKGFETPSRKIEIYNKGYEKYGFNPLPTWEDVPAHKGLKDGEMVLVTFKWWCHNSSETANTKFLSETIHSNPAWLNRETAKKMGIKDGSLIRLTTPAGYMITKVKTTEGIHPKVVAVSTSAGHSALGRVASINPKAHNAMWSSGKGDEDIKENLWWKDKGVHPNDIIPVSFDPLGGSQAWSDTVVAVSPAKKGDKYGEIKVDNAVHHAFYKETIRWTYKGDIYKKMIEDREKAKAAPKEEEG